MLEWMSTNQLEAIIVHELLHIKRFDYLFHWLISFIEIVFFFNPTVWIMKKIISQEREYSCDFLANAKLMEPLTYCKTLYQLQATKIKPESVLSFHHNKNLLMKRMLKIFGNYQPQFPVLPLVTAVMVVIFFMTGYQSAPGGKYSLSNADDFLSNSAIFDMPQKPRPLPFNDSGIKPSDARSTENLKEAVKANAPRPIRDDTIKIKLKKDEEIEIKSKTEGKTIFLNNK
jgi:hypothetical protein